MAVPRPSLQSQLGKRASELAQREGHPQGKTKLPTGCAPLKQLCSGLPFSRSRAAAKRWQKGGGEEWERASSTPNYSWLGQWEKHWAKEPQTLPRDSKMIQGKWNFSFPQPTVLPERPYSHHVPFFLRIPEPRENRSPKLFSCPLRFQFWKWYYSEYPISGEDPKGRKESHRALATELVWKKHQVTWGSWKGSSSDEHTRVYVKELMKARLLPLLLGHNYRR